MKAVATHQPCTDADCGDKLPRRSSARTRRNLARVARFAGILTAMGTEPRLRIMQLLLSAHPEGLVVGDIQSELEIAPSTLSHHLEKLKNEDLVSVRRDKKFLWYAANPEVLEELLGFLFAECCSRSKAVIAETIFKLCR